MPRLPQSQRCALLTVKQAAQRLNVSTRTVRRLIDTGALAFVRIGRSIRIDEGDLEATIERWRERVI